MYAFLFINVSMNTNVKLGMAVWVASEILGGDNQLPSRPRKNRTVNIMMGLTKLRMEYVEIRLLSLILPNKSKLSEKKISARVIINIPILVFSKCSNSLNNNVFQIDTFLDFTNFSVESV